ncbi:hypothetical protein KZ813_16780 [Sphingomonas sp. RHCKR7]|uniref:hypothetical protein n=1 Tax=Sphingomonas folli TaxID=2862497 RepID=UPI001CA56D9D|nr:hypothetical protein [Sphingomonas folli]MBW6528500.1 hypothetical protein [Sphingomonas folli]
MATLERRVMLKAEMVARFVGRRAIVVVDVFSEVARTARSFTWTPLGRRRF